MAEELLHTPDKRDGRSTPLFESAIPGPSSVTTPTGNTPLSPGSRGHSETPNIGQISRSPSPGTSTGKVPPEAPLFSFPDDGPERPRAPFSPQVTLSSDIPVIDWGAARDDSETRRLAEFYTARMVPPPNKATGSRPGSENDDKTGDDGVIDLTNDSQESEGR